MTNMTSRETQGRSSLHHETCNHLQPQSCGHDCSGCLTDFEQTQQQTEQLRVALLHEHSENQQLWLNARGAMRQTLFDLVPQRRIAGVPGETREFHDGWDRCRAEIEHRIQELLKVI